MQNLIDQTTAGGIAVNDCNTHYAGIVLKIVYKIYVFGQLIQKKIIATKFGLVYLNIL